MEVLYLGYNSIHHLCGLVILGLILLGGYGNLLQHLVVVEVICFRSQDGVLYS